MTQRHTLWRPRVNFATAAGFLLVGGLMVITTGYGGFVYWPAVLGFLVLAGRAALIRVVLHPDGITVCNRFRTHRLRWTDVFGVGRPNPSVARPAFCLMTLDGRAIRLEAFPVGPWRPDGRYEAWAELIDRTRVERAGPVPLVIPGPTA
jgi:Bacterial PH domain